MSDAIGCLLAVLLLVVLAGPALAAAPQPAQLTASDRADVQRIEQYLNGIHSMSARFQQFSEDGGTASGLLYLARPGRMRFEYDAPSKILLIADGTFVVYIDYGLGQVTYLPIGSTPAWFLLRPHISLTEGVTVTRFARGADAIRVTMVETASPDNGSLTLTFSDRPLALRQWTIVDQQGRKTTVVLSNPEYGVPIDPKLFTFVDPRKKQEGAH